MSLATLSSTNLPPSELEAKQIRMPLQRQEEAISQKDGSILRTSGISALEQVTAVVGTELAVMRSILSPIRDFPAEILSEIFLLCLELALKSDSYSNSDAFQLPTLFGRICSLWRAIFITTPRLW
ncbi:hypothetical protein B0H17DRAFT_1147506 [Mycena rosella]|uniref:F-box domain-containing protein n=1 Tax=Mycena rosella TaxID=1033263 RepID=A0AAD7G2A1_MYCRO|nr:hypothetical protein B0H17DRAFT_1147506 [Mycena rosella]